MSRNALYRCFSTSQKSVLSIEATKYLRKTKNKVAGIDGMPPGVLLENASLVQKVAKSALDGEFRPSGLFAIPIAKPGGKSHRIICVPTAKDRLVQHLIHFYILKISKRRDRLAANPISFGVGAKDMDGTKAALRQSVAYRRQNPVVLKIDISRYFDTINRRKLKRRYRAPLQTPSLNSLIDAFIDSEISGGIGRDWHQIVAKEGVTKGLGLRQGMPLSPVLSAMMLHNFDRDLGEKFCHSIRYVDDIAIFVSTRSEAEEAYGFARERLENSGLTVPDLGTSKCQIYNPNQPADFLGMEISPDGADGYGLSIPRDVFRRVSRKFDSFADPEFLEDEQLVFDGLSRRLQSMESGYMASYAEASNLHQLRKCIETSKSNVVETILKNAFGDSAVSGLSVKQRRFFGLGNTG